MTRAYDMTPDPPDRPERLGDWGVRLAQDIMTLINARGASFTSRSEIVAALRGHYDVRGIEAKIDELIAARLIRSLRF